MKKKRKKGRIRERNERYKKGKKRSCGRKWRRGL
jgi:hypothetical protein